MYITVKLIHMLSNMITEILVEKQMINAIMHPFSRILMTTM